MGEFNSMFQRTGKPALVDVSVMQPPGCKSPICVIPNVHFISKVTCLNSHLSLTVIIPMPLAWLLKRSLTVLR